MTLYDGDLFLGQAIQLIHQRVYLHIRGLDPAPVELLVAGDGGGSLGTRTEDGVRATPTLDSFRRWVVDERDSPELLARPRAPEVEHF